MALELVPAKPEHVPELGRITYEAFKDISDKHHFPSDFASVAYRPNAPRDADAQREPLRRHGDVERPARRLQLPSRCRTRSAASARSPSRSRSRATRSAAR